MISKRYRFVLYVDSYIDHLREIRHRERINFSKLRDTWKWIRGNFTRGLARMQLLSSTHGYGAISRVSSDVVTYVDLRELKRKWEVNISPRPKCQLSKIEFV